MEGKKIFCLFGEHLLKDKTKLVAVVEAPKTAIIASVYLPQFIWVAVGARSYLTEDRCQVLAGRKVVLYPDLSKPRPDKLTTFEKWSARAKELACITHFKVSDMLERKATDKERERGLDLADYLVRFDINQFSQATEKTPNPPSQAPEEYSEVITRTDPELTPVPVLHQQPEPAPNPLNPIEEHWTIVCSSILHQPIEHCEVEDLEQFFNNTPLPTGPVQLSAWETITDVPTFIGCGLGYVKANHGRKAFKPYYDRLQLLKEYMQERQVILTSSAA